MNRLQRGHHISMPGEYSSYFVKHLGKRLSLYRHHAIVIDIDHKSCETADVTLIHFYKEGKEIKVCKQTRAFNLCDDELYIIEYQHPKYDLDTVVKRAESVLEESENGKLFLRYNIFTRNCEHFATWCVLGKRTSLQARTFTKDIKEMLWYVLRDSNKIVRLILKAFVECEEVTPSIVNGIFLFPFISLEVSTAARITYSVIKTVYLIQQYKKEKSICWHCLKEKLLDLWLQFGVFGVTSVFTFVIVTFALPLLSPSPAIPITIVLLLIGTALSVAVPRIRKALWSPVQYIDENIKNVSEIKDGDVVSLTYYGLTHLVVVSEVQLDTNPEQGVIQGIHYSLPSLFGTRVISEEKFQIDLTKSKVTRVNFNISCSYLPQEVVDRAKKRIGERKWNMSSNRSDHFCRWAIEKSDFHSEQIECLEDKDTKFKQSRSLSSLLMEKVYVHLMNEIQPGDVVKYKSYKGIVISLEGQKDGREFNMDTVVRKSCIKFYGKKVMLRINLNKYNLVVYRYHPAHCASMSKRVEKAQGMIGKEIQCLTWTGFIKDIILKQRENN